MHSVEEQLRIASRRAKVVELTLRGYTQFEICAKLGMELSQQPTISRDLKEAREEWRQTLVREISELQDRELEKLDNLERQYWQAWERSCVEKQTRRARRRATKQGMNSGSPTNALNEETEEIKVQRDGDPRFLDGVLKCINKRCEILGLDAAIRLKVGGDPDGSPLRHQVQAMPAEQFRALPDHEKIRLMRERNAAWKGN